MAKKMAKRKANRGCFKPGHPGGPGRPPRQTEDAYLISLRAAVTPEHWRRVVARALKDAQSGDAKARAWLSRYLLPQRRDGDIADALGSILEALK